MSHPSPNRPVAMSALRRMRLRAAALIPLLALIVALTSPGAQAAPKTSSINLPKAYLEKPLQDLLDPLVRLHPELYDREKDAYVIGPIPKGTPINLLSNTNLDPGLDLGVKRIALFGALIDAVLEIKAKHLNDAAALQVMQTKVVPKFLALNKCPDFYEDKGHPFGQNLSRPEKDQLIALLKTF